MPGNSTEQPHSGTKLTRISHVLSYAILAGGIATVVFSAYMVAITYSPLPFSDGWVQIFSSRAGEDPLSWQWLWRLHNEHRLILPKLFLVGDLRLFHATQVSLLTSIFVIQLLLLVLLGWSMRVLGGWRGSWWRSGAGLAAFCLFCPTQWENFVWGFQTCFVLPGLFATLSFLGLLLYSVRWRETDKRGAWKFLLLSVIAALGATYSLANGNLLWPLLLVAALLLRLPLAAALSYGISGAISTALYLHNYVRPPQNSNPAVSIQSPLKLLQYLTIYFGSTWVRENTALVLPVLLGAAGLALAAVFLWRGRRVEPRMRPFQLQLLLILLFCVGTGFLTALGRVSSGDMQAFSSRYQTIALLFWCCLGLLLLGTCFASHSRTLSVLMQTALLAVLLRGAVLARFPLRDAREHAFQLHAAAVALQMEVNDSKQLKEAFPIPEYVIGFAPLMREDHLSIFAKKSTVRLGDKFSADFPIASPDRCAGALQSVEDLTDAAHPALRITGWAWDRKDKRPPASMVAVADGAVVGFGAIGDWRPMIRAANHYLKTSFIGFTGYAKPPDRNTEVSVYGVLSGDMPQACYVTKVPPGVP